MSDLGRSGRGGTTVPRHFDHLEPEGGMEMRERHEDNDEWFLSKQAGQYEGERESVTAGSLADWEPSMDGVVARVGKGDGAAESLEEAEPRVSG